MANLAGDWVEQRLTAILAADVAGYSRLMGADEEGTLVRLKAHRRELVDPKIAEHRGRIVKTAGDGLLGRLNSAPWFARQISPKLCCPTGGGTDETPALALLNADSCSLRYAAAPTSASTAPAASPAACFLGLL
jgi:class 3 adenylate cyclase